MRPMDGGGRGRYSAEAWEQTRREALERPAAEAPPQAVGRSHSPSTLVPGVVEMSLRGDDSDVERLVTAMRDMGVVVWRANSSGTQSGNRAGYRYFSVEVPRGSDG